MAVTRAKGTKLYFGDGESPEAFDLVNKLLEMGVPGPTWDTEEVTPLETESLRKEFLATIADEGELTFTILYDPEDQIHEDLKTLSNTSVVRNWRIVYAGIIGQVDFEGFITAAVVLNPKAEYVKWQFTVKVTGLASDAVPATIVSAEIIDEFFPDYQFDGGGGDTMRIRITFDEVVIVDTGGGTPSIGIDIDGTPKAAAYASGSGTHQLVFEYEADLAASAADFDLDDEITLNSGTIEDAGGNSADLTFTDIDTSLVTITDNS